MGTVLYSGVGNSVQSKEVREGVGESIPKAVLVVTNGSPLPLHPAVTDPLSLLSHQALLSVAAQVVPPAGTVGVPSWGGPRSRLPRTHGIMGGIYFCCSRGGGRGGEGRGTIANLCVVHVYVCLHDM